MVFYEELPAALAGYLEQLKGK